MLIRVIPENLLSLHNYLIREIFCRLRNTSFSEKQYFKRNLITKRMKKQNKEFQILLILTKEKMHGIYVLKVLAAVHFKSWFFLSLVFRHLNLLIVDMMYSGHFVIVDSFSWNLQNNMQISHRKIPIYRTLIQQTVVIADTIC